MGSSTGKSDISELLIIIDAKVIRFHVKMKASEAGQ